MIGSLSYNVTLTAHGEASNVTATRYIHFVLSVDPNSR